jgi:hypothetical protein
MAAKKPIAKKSASKKMSEYGGMENYASKKSMMLHEKKEGKSVETAEKKAYKSMMSKKKK